MEKPTCYNCKDVKKRLSQAMISYTNKQTASLFSTPYTSRPVPYNDKTRYRPLLPHYYGKCERHKENKTASQTSVINRWLMQSEYLEKLSPAYRLLLIHVLLKKYY